VGYPTISTTYSQSGPPIRRRRPRPAPRVSCQKGLSNPEVRGWWPWPKGESPMSLAMVMAFEILAALALGFVIGRIWQIRRDELDRRNFKVPPVARIPRLQSPLSAR